MPKSYTVHGFHECWAFVYWFVCSAVVFLMRSSLFIFFALSSFRLFGGLVTYYTWEIGAGYKDSGGRYMAHGTGTFVTYPSTKKPTGWNTGFYGQETVISGSKDQNLLTPYTAVIYIGANAVNDTPENTDSPLLDGTPYSGGPVQSNDGNWNNLNDKTPASPGTPNIPNNLTPPDNQSDWDQLLDLMRQLYISYAKDENGDTYGSLVRIGEDGDNYVLYGVDGNEITRWPKSQGKFAPIQYKDASGNLVWGWYNPNNGEITATRPNADGTQSDLQAVVNSIEGVKVNQEALRNQLIQQLGAAGNSWVYDCKLSLSELQDLASALGLKVDTVNQNLGNIASALYNNNGRPLLSVVADYASSANSTLGTMNSTVGSINNSLSSMKTTQTTIKNNLNTVNQNIVNTYNGLHSDLTGIKTSIDSQSPTDYTTLLESIRDKLPDATYTLPTMPLPDISNEQSPDDELPFKWDGWSGNAQQTFNTLVAWGQNPLNGFPVNFDVISGFLNTFIGSIPSVGTDAHMFDVSFNLPVIGSVQKSFNFSDWPAISYFRTACLWFLYVFFGLAIFKLLHASII